MVTTKLRVLLLLSLLPALLVAGAVCGPADPSAAAPPRSPGPPLRGPISFAPAASYSVGTNGAIGVASGDFNNNGKPGTATTAGLSNNIAVLPGRGGGVFGGAVTDATGTAVFAATDAMAEGATYTASDVNRDQAVYNRSIKWR